MDSKARMARRVKLALAIAGMTAAAPTAHAWEMQSGEWLFALINAPKRFVRFPEGEHENLGMFGALEAARTFMAEPFE